MILTYSARRIASNPFQIPNVIDKFKSNFPKAVWRRQVNILRSYLSIGSPFDSLVTNFETRDTRALSGLLAAHRFSNRRKIPQRSEDAWTQHAIDLSHTLFDWAEGKIEFSDQVMVPGLPGDNHNGPVSRILLVAHSDPRQNWNGYAIRTHEIAKALIGHDLEVAVVTKPRLNLNEAAIAQDETIDGVHYYALDPLGMDDISVDRYLTKYCDGVSRVIDMYQPHIVHSGSNFLTGLAGGIAGKRHRLPTLYEMRGRWELTRLVTHKGYRKSPGFKAQTNMESFVSTRSDFVLALNGQLRDMIIDAGVNADAVGILPNCGMSGGPIGNENVSPEEIAPPLFKNGGDDAEFCTFGYIGSLVDYEGLFLLLDAFEALCKSRGDIRLMVAGSGSLNAAIRTRMKQSAHSDNMKFLTRLSNTEARALHNAIDVIVIPRLPSDVTRLVTPIKPFTAFQSGVPCLMSDVQPLSEIAEQSQAAILFKAGNGADLRRKMNDIADDKPLRESLGRSGRHWIRTERNWVKQTENLLEIYNQINAHYCDKSRR